MIRRATPADVQPITDMIYELADYQKALDECTVKAEQIGEALFGPAATAFAHVAVNSADDVVGMALWFRNFSTWDGAHGIYLEDLYVKPSQRGSGHGKALLAALAKECTDNDYTRLSWSVLNWNTPSIKFYESLGADAKTEWTTYRLTGTHLGALAAEAEAEAE
ncbi:GNAT family N-acetyltransferase [Rhodococcus baikonurensis]|uniref:GNAT family N-acetyltransferase n=1 Tax=Rhodococcus baikonurensis TaxID=172041 RepID=UPI0037B7C3B6